MHFDESKYKVWTWKHPLVLHFILNPGLVINELLLGQRVPQVMLVEKDKTKSLAEKSFVPCPHCGTIHPNAKWSVQNGTAFKNWFGLYCDQCGNIIPCVRNLTSLIILGIMLPFWYPIRKRLKKRWLQQQKEKFSKPLILTEPELKWWQEGLGWGAFMFITISLYELVAGDEVFTLFRVLSSAIIWMTGGLLFGYIIGRKAVKTSAAKEK